MLEGGGGGGGLRNKRVRDDDATDPIRSGGGGVPGLTQQELNDFKGGCRTSEAMNKDSF